MAGVGDDSEANIVGDSNYIVEDSNDIEETDAFAVIFYQERKNLEKVIMLLTMKKTRKKKKLPLFIIRIFQVWTIRKLCWNGSMQN